MKGILLWSKKVCASGPLLSSAYIPGSSKVMFASRNEVLVFDAVSGKLIRKFQTQNEIITWIGWSPDGKYFVTADNKGLIIVHNAKEEVITQIKIGSQINQCCFSPTSTALFVAANDQYAVIYDVRRADILKTKKTKSRVLGCSVSADGIFYSVGQEDGKVVIMFSSTLEVHMKFQTDGPVHAMQFGIEHSEDKQTRGYSITEPNSDLNRGAGMLREPQQQITNAIENTLAFAGWDQQLHIVRVRDGSQISEGANLRGFLSAKAQRGALKHGSFSPGKFRAETQKMNEVLRSGVENEENGIISFLPLTLSYCYNHNYILVGGCNGTLSIYSKTGIFLKKLAKLSNDDTWITDIALHHSSSPPSSGVLADNSQNSNSQELPNERDRIIITTLTGRVVSIRTAFSTVHSMCDTIYSYRDMMTTVKITDLSTVIDKTDTNLSLLVGSKQDESPPTTISGQSLSNPPRGTIISIDNKKNNHVQFRTISIRLDGLIKRIAVCGNKVAVQVTGKIVVIDYRKMMNQFLNELNRQNNTAGSQQQPRQRQKRTDLLDIKDLYFDCDSSNSVIIHKDFDTGLRGMTDNALIVCTGPKPGQGGTQARSNRLQVLSFSCQVIHSWLLPTEATFVRVLNNSRRHPKGSGVPAMSGSEAIVVGLANCEVRMYYLNRSDGFCQLVRPYHGVANPQRSVRCVDVSPDLKYVAVVDARRQCKIYRTPSEAAAEEIKRELASQSMFGNNGGEADGLDKSGIGFGGSETVDSSQPVYSYSNILSVCWNTHCPGVLMMTTSGGDILAGDTGKDSPGATEKGQSGASTSGTVNYGALPRLVVAVGPTPVFSVVSSGFPIAFMGHSILLYSNTPQQAGSSQGTGASAKITLRRIPLSPLIDLYLHHGKFNSAIAIASNTPVGVAPYVWRCIGTRALLKALSYIKYGPSSPGSVSNDITSTALTQSGAPSFLELVDAVRESYVRLGDFSMLLLIDKIARAYAAGQNQTKGTKGPPTLMVLVAQCYAYMHEHSSALKIFLSYNRLTDAVQLLYFAKGDTEADSVGQRGGLDAELKRFLSKGQDYANVIRKQSDFLLGLGDNEGAAALYVSIGDYSSALAIYTKTGSISRVVDLAKAVPKTNRKVLQKIRMFLEQCRLFDKAGELAATLGDVSSLIRYEIIAGNWHNALLLAASHPHLAPGVYSQYASYLAARGLLEESYIYFRKAGNSRVILELLLDMVSADIRAGNFAHASALLIRLSAEHVRAACEIIIRSDAKASPNTPPRLILPSDSSPIDMSGLSLDNVSQQDRDIVRWHGVSALSLRYKALVYRAYADVLHVYQRLYHITPSNGDVRDNTNGADNSGLTAEADADVDGLGADAFTIPNDTLAKCLFVLSVRHFPSWFIRPDSLTPQTSSTNTQAQGNTRSVVAIKPDTQDAKLWATAVPLIPPAAVSTARPASLLPQGISERVVLEVIAKASTGDRQADTRTASQAYSSLLLMNSANSLPAAFARTSPFSSLPIRSLESSFLHLCLKAKTAKAKQPKAERLEKTKVNVNEPVVEQGAEQAVAPPGMVERCPRCQTELSRLSLTPLRLSSVGQGSQNTFVVSSTFMDRCSLCGMSILRCAASFRVLPLVEVVAASSDEMEDAVEAALLTPVFDTGIVQVGIARAEAAKVAQKQRGEMIDKGNGLQILKIGEEPSQYSQQSQISQISQEHDEMVDGLVFDQMGSSSESHDVNGAEGRYNTNGKGLHTKRFRSPTEKVMGGKLGVTGDPYIHLTIEEMQGIDPVDVFVVAEPVVPLTIDIGHEHESSSVHLASTARRFFVNVRSCISVGEPNMSGGIGVMDRRSKLGVGGVLDDRGDGNSFGLGNYTSTAAGVNTDEDGEDEGIVQCGLCRFLFRAPVYYEAVSVLGRCPLCMTTSVSL